jgi:hypothetical protein
MPVQYLAIAPQKFTCPASEAAAIYASLGDKDEAMKRLDKGYPE